MPRPTKLRAEVADLIVGLVENGMPRVPAARAAGIHPSTLYSWLRRGEAEQDQGEVDHRRHSRGELLAMCDDLDLDYTASMTKPELAAVINAYESEYVKFADRLRAADARYMAHALSEAQRTGREDWRFWMTSLEARFPQHFARGRDPDLEDDEDAQAGDAAEAQRMIERAEAIKVKMLGAG